MRKASHARLPETHKLRVGDRSMRVHFRIDHPTIAILENVLDASECEALIALSRPRMRQALVIDRETGQGRVDAGRRGNAVELHDDVPAWLGDIERRATEITGLPYDNAEALQVVQYLPGGEYKPHHDYFPADHIHANLRHAEAGQRLSTLIMYLNDVPEGGETYFPDLKLAVKARRGWGLYFENCDTLGQVMPLTLHGGAPVERGEKWIATKWMRERPLRRVP